MTAPTQDTATAWKAIQLLATMNRLALKANACKTQKALTFLILNETIRLIQYNRATLWTWKNNTFTLIGVSSAASFNAQSEHLQKYKEVLEHLEKKEEKQVIPPSVTKVGKATGDAPSPDSPSMLWLPFPGQKDTRVGLCLERWTVNRWMEDEKEITGFLLQNYAIAWDRFEEKAWWKGLSTKRNLWIGLGIAALILAMPLSLPISAPCEIVAKNPYIVTSPLEGVIDKVAVIPGQNVKAGALLFTYDGEIMRQQKRSAEEQVRVLGAQLDRAYILGMDDDKYLQELAGLKYRYQKEKAFLDLANYRVNQLDVEAPVSGYIIMDSPEKWQGNPVKVGEKVLTITPPGESKVKIWIPEADKIWIDPEKPVKVFLNVEPENSYLAKITYIATESSLDEQSIPSFVAEAEWIEAPEDHQLGLKGSATLYGPRVSIFYWLIRKPWTYLRHISGF